MYFILFCVAIATAVCIYWKLIRPHSHWKRLGVKQGKPAFLMGDNSQATKKHSFVEMVHHMYKLSPQDRYTGVYMMLNPMLLVRDPELIKQITVKDFDHFSDHVQMMPTDHDKMWSQNLFTMRGEKWRDMRATLSPAFTGSKMKLMFELMRECGEQFTSHFEETYGDETVELELKDAFQRFGTDVIASCAFGVKCDSQRERNNDFYLMGKEMTDMASFRKRMMFFVMFISPKLAQFFGFTFFPKKVEDFFLDLVRSTVEYREKNNIIRPDMIHLLMEARNGRLQHDALENTKDTGFATVEESAIGKDRRNKTEKQEITLEIMTAQALLFFFGGFDSAATLASLCSYELALNPDIQERLREEIHETLRECNGKITYEALINMKYMDMVVAEALRKWPPGSVADRLCVKDYTIEPRCPGEPRINLKEGDKIWIPYIGLHRDEKYFPDPERFDPERFNDENKANIKPYTYFPFGSGPRNCIASRFALLETKTAMFYLLNKYELTVIDRTPIPLVLERTGFALNAEGGFWIGFKPIKRAA